MSPKITYRKDYTPPDFSIDTIDLKITLGEEVTVVESRLHLIKQKNVPLVLQGRELALISVTLNEQAISVEKDSETLTIAQTPDDFILEIVTHIKPQLNTSLEGLYKTKALFCTQCEAEGFRKITYYLDRPDVMAKFSTMIIADKTAYPVLLSNGNLIETGLLDNNLHYAKWQDPFKKPCYLFALVAGDLACIEDHFITCTGRKVDIKLYVDPGDEDKTSFAIGAIKRAMRWDEENFGREYDLDIFMVVATHAFNMGAMENKGLNIFNAKYILAKSETATDEDYTAIERVIGHEYFHNWTGNRITCRDWFQLSLKESLTVFRDAQFSSDMTSHAAVRIGDVNVLRSVQFPQDASPMAHSVRPESYIEINNFYTVTIYEKGAEIIRMLSVLLGKAGFRKGMDVYFERHDGQAVRIEEFVQAHADANQIELSQFMQWYEKAGTPELFISTNFDAPKKQYKIHIKQSGFNFYLPFSIGLIDETGKDIVTQTLVLKNAEETFVFENVEKKPVPSLLRDFSAPVKIHYDYTPEELAFLLAHDSDAAARWDAGQQLASYLIKNLMTSHKIDCSLIVEAWRKLLEDNNLDAALAAQLFTLPSESYLIELFAPVDLDKLLKARKFLRHHLAVSLQDLWLSRYQSAEDSIGGRALKNRCLSYLGLVDTAACQSLILSQLASAQNMTDEIAALQAISHSQSIKREEALDHFYHKFQKETLVIDKWFSLQARSERPDVLTHVKRLMHHPAFDIKNPNKVRALVGAFSQNFPAFHLIDGSGYDFLTDQIILLNKINPNIGARLCEPFTRFKKYDETRQNLMKAALQKIVHIQDLSPHIYEVVSKTLEN
jgi:aminopeptidase N